MADNKNRFQRALDFLNRPPERYNVGVKRDINLDPDRINLNGPVYGYNTNAGYFPDTNDVGDGTGNSAVVACLEVLSTSFSEAYLEVYEMDTDTNQYEIVHNHPVAKLFRRPNPYMSGELLNSYLMYSLHANGDAYIFKRRSEAGRVVELHPIMPHLITPRGNTKKLITHYDYELPDGKVVIKREDMIHVRLNVDPHDHRRGRAPLKNVLREVVGDEAAGQFATALLTNIGVPGVILSPKGGDDIFGGPTKEQADQISEAYKTKFGGANRGAPMVLSGPMDVDVVSFSPEQLNLNELRRVPEERISAVLGVPAILAGLGAGLESATYSNARSLREFFTENKLVPLWRIVAGELSYQILKQDFTDNDNLILRYDTSAVKSLAEDRAELIKSMDVGVKGGWVSLAEARQAVGLPTDESHNIYLRSLQWEQLSSNDSEYDNTYSGADNTGEEPQPYQDQMLDETEALIVDDEEPKETIEVLDAFGKNKEQKDLLSTVSFPTEAIRTDVPMPTPTRLGLGEKYVAEMPNGAFCVIGHDTGKVIRCFPTRKEADNFLKRIEGNKKQKAEVDVFETQAEAETRAEQIGCEGSHTHDHDGNILYMPCSTHEVYERMTQDKPEVPDNIEYSKTIEINEEFVKTVMDEFAQEVEILAMEAKKPGDPATRNAGGPKLDKDDITNFPERGDNLAIRLSNSKHKVFPDHAFVQKMKDEYPTLWRSAGTGGNPPTAFTGNDAFRLWTKYRQGDRSTAVLAWVRRRELYMGRHGKDKRIKGVIAAMKWGGLLPMGATEMKAIVREAMKKIDDRNKK